MVRFRVFCIIVLCVLSESVVLSISEPPCAQQSEAATPIACHWLAVKYIRRCGDCLWRWWRDFCVGLSGVLVFRSRRDYCRWLVGLE